MQAVRGRCSIHKGMKVIAALLLLGVVAGAGCGSDKDVIGRYGPQAANLDVVVRPDGPGGPELTNNIRCGRFGPGAPGSAECAELAGFTARDLAPTPAGRACAAIYGGPATATVRGAVLGQRVAARFTLENSCEIGRWRRNVAILGPPPRGG
jgi:hypothetical protein